MKFDIKLCVNSCAGLPWITGSLAHGLSGGFMCNIFISFIYYTLKSSEIGLMTHHCRLDTS
jgi:hypothetical protein